MSIFEASGTLELNSPLTKECWDILADVELENTESMWFTTPSGKRVDYIRADILDKIQSEIEALNPVDCVSIYSYEGHEGARDMKSDVLRILDKYIEEI